jgi:hypothetical protein
MSFFLAGSALLLALLAGIILDSVGGRRWQAAREVTPFDAW